MDLILAVLMGVALAAACGFRIFVPLLVAAIGVRSGDIAVTQSFAWVGSDAALVLLGVATTFEVLAYYVPWVDNALDLVATPVAVVAGTLVTASFIVDMSPMFRWTLAILAGGGIAGTVQLATAGVRAISTATTGGLANPIVSTTETAMATVLAILAVVVPIIAAMLLAVVMIWIVRRIHRVRVARMMQARMAYQQMDVAESQASAVGRVKVTARVIESMPG